MKFKLLGSIGVLGTIAQLNAMPTIAETPAISKLQDLPRTTTAKRWLAQKEPTPSAAQVTWHEESTLKQSTIHLDVF